jgi:hypothetical protein
MGGKQNNANTKNLWNRICLYYYIEIISVGNTEYSSSFCLHSVVIV